MDGLQLMLLAGMLQLEPHQLSREGSSSDYDGDGDDSG
jgi:hypothetical protein